MIQEEECQHSAEDLEIQDWEMFTPEEGRKGIKLNLYCWNCDKKFVMTMERSTKELTA